MALIQFNFLKYRKIYFTISGILTLGGLICLIVFGLNLGIDFTGGSILEIEYLEARPSNQAIKEKLTGLDLGTIYVQPTRAKGVIIRMKHISEQTHQEVLQKLRQNHEIIEMRFESIGPIIGHELKQKAIMFIVMVLFSIVLYIMFAFRKVQNPIKGWQYGTVSLIALFHDVLMPIAAFSILGEFYGAQVTIPIVVALLAILGYSINDTVVILDRIRENLIKKIGITFEETVNKSLNQTITRCVNTSLTTLLVLIAIFFFGGVTLRDFALVLIIGIVAGTYSSIFLVSPILVSWLNRRRNLT